MQVAVFVLTIIINHIGNHIISLYILILWLATKLCSNKKQNCKRREPVKLSDYPEYTLSQRTGAESENNTYFNHY